MNRKIEIKLLTLKKGKSMRTNLVLFAAMIFLGSTFIGCSQNKKSKGNNKSEVLTESKESHAREYKEGEGEEDGTMYGINEKVDIQKNGVRLILSFDKNKSAFIGSFGNITNKELSKVRVEIHLSNGKELGPTSPTTLKPDEKRKFQLNAKGEKFEKWSTHAEVGNNERGHGNKEGHEGRESGEHDSERSEHNWEGSSEHR